MRLRVARVCGNWLWSWTQAGHAGAAGGLASKLEVGRAGERPWGATPPSSERCSSLASSLPPRACPRPRWSAFHPPGPPGCGSALWWLTRSVLAHAWPWAPCTETDCPGETVEVHQLAKNDSHPHKNYLSKDHLVLNALCILKVIFWHFPTESRLANVCKFTCWVYGWTGIPAHYQ